MERRREMICAVVVAVGAENANAVEITIAAARSALDRVAETGKPL